MGRALLISSCQLDMLKRCCSTGLWTHLPHLGRADASQYPPLATYCMPSTCKVFYRHYVIWSWWLIYGGNNISSILQMRRWRLIEIKLLLRDHIASPCQDPSTSQWHKLFGSYLIPLFPPTFFTSNPSASSAGFYLKIDPESKHLIPSPLLWS